MAFGDGARIIWDKNSEAVFKGNPNIARPGSERDQNIEWNSFRKGNRGYNTQHLTKPRWIWNYDFKATPGELFFDNAERRNGARYGEGFVIIEPEVPRWKTVAPNKDWGRKKYQALADRLRKDGLRLAQFRYDKGGPVLDGVEHFRTLSFRDAAAILSNSALFVGPEGGLHHAAAAVGKPAVVIFGGFIPPSVTGYETHINLTGGAEACGMYQPCAHCKAAMDAISVEEAHDAAMRMLGGR